MKAPPLLLECRILSCPQNKLGAFLRKRAAPYFTSSTSSFSAENALRCNALNFLFLW